MDENKVRSIVTDMLSSMSNPVCPWHTHNDVDTPRLQSNNLLPYTIQSGTSVTSVLSGSTKFPDGTIQFYNIQESTFKDWGIDIVLGGIWNAFTIVPSGVGANLSTGQTFPNGTPTILIADNVFYDLYPTHEYSNTDGTFTCTTTGRYLIDCGVTFDNTGSNSGFAVITIVLEHMATPIKFMQKTQFFDTTDTFFSLDISGIIEVQANDLLYIQIEQNTGRSSLTTLTDENTWFNVHKMK